MRLANQVAIVGTESFPSLGRRGRMPVSADRTGKVETLGDPGAVSRAAALGRG